MKKGVIIKFTQEWKRISTKNSFGWYKLCSSVSKSLSLELTDAFHSHACKISR